MAVNWLKTKAPARKLCTQWDIPHFNDSSKNPSPLLSKEPETQEVNSLTQRLGPPRNTPRFLSHRHSMGRVAWVHPLSLPHCGWYCSSISLNGSRRATCCWSKRIATSSSTLPSGNAMAVNNCALLPPGTWAVSILNQSPCAHDHICSRPERPAPCSGIRMPGSGSSFLREKSLS